jgi:hypothetical protein
MHRLAADLPGVELAARCDVQEAGRHTVAEAAAAEVRGDPDRAVDRLDQQVDVVVAGSDRAQLRLGPLPQRPRALAPGDLLGRLRYLGPRLGSTAGARRGWRSCGRRRG